MNEDDEAKDYVHGSLDMQFDNDSSKDGRPQKGEGGGVVLGMPKNKDSKHEMFHNIFFAYYFADNHVFG